MIGRALILALMDCLFSPSPGLSIVLCLLEYLFLLKDFITLRFPALYMFLHAPINEKASHDIACMKYIITSVSFE